MKPGEYYAQYRDRLNDGEETDAICFGLQCQFLAEARALMHERRTKNDLEILDVLKEQEAKWIQLSRMSHGTIPSNGFVFGIFSVVPDIYKAAEVRGFLDLLKNHNQQGGTHG